MPLSYFTPPFVWGFPLCCNIRWSSSFSAVALPWCHASFFLTYVICRCLHFLMIWAMFGPSEIFTNLGSNQPILLLVPSTPLPCNVSKTLPIWLMTKVLAPFRFLFILLRQLSGRTFSWSYFWAYVNGVKVFTKQNWQNNFWNKWDYFKSGGAVGESE